ncbi:hypothetical protein PPL_01691 [Heterostelium album PN500]|uniref:Uncharacterized protein n=1 Tax=Heterostelium pallidum (strain ATCC 26659 / Pp 5 / PN500) TaxID=670386 RepID=D3B075_HETP5|nr:hypothetical protein PPL_01691 [Heterostelium album PN500]EFA84699.1 hypothetical protein PPL_01691 [Heterostelium album PN500]|eukprot:XP_020436812.1 hypothetical protein PPL_01691 [Heterostelium album PN500]
MILLLIQRVELYDKNRYRKVYYLTPSVDSILCDSDDNYIQLVKNRVISTYLNNFYLGNDNAVALGNTLQNDGTFNTINYQDQSRENWHPLKHMDNLVQIAFYLKQTSPFNTELFNKTDTALGYFVDQYSNFTSVNPYNTKQLLPMVFAYKYLIINNITGAYNGQSQSRSQDLMKSFTSLLNANGNYLTQVSNAYCVLFSSLNANDKVTLNQTIKKFTTLLTFTPGQQEGIKTDGSFFENGPMLNNGNYGNEILEIYFQIISLLSDRIPADSINVFNTLALQGNQWMIYSNKGNGYYHPAAVGSNITQIQGTQFYASPFMKLYQSRKAEYLVWLNRMNGSDPSLNTGNRQFFISDYMIHSRKTYSASLKYSSKRVLNSECVNIKEGLPTQKMSDGSFFLMVDGGKEYDGIYPLLDWQMIPGITSEPNYQQPVTCDKVSTLGNTVFDGSLSDGQYGMAVLDLHPSYSNDMTGKKSWFFFDEHIVFLGSNITSSSTDPNTQLLTSIDQRFYRQPVYTSLNQTSPLYNFDNSLNITWYHHNKIAVLFPTLNSTTPTTNNTKIPNNSTVNSNSTTGIDNSTVPIGANVFIKAQSKGGSWENIGSSSGGVSDTLLLTYIQHTPANQNQYQYMMIPNIEYSNFTSRIDSLFAAISIMRNDDHFHAVYHNELKLLQIVFWDTKQTFVTPFGFNITSGQPILLQVNMKNVTYYKLTVSDPTQTLSTVNIVFRALELSGSFASFSSMTNYTTIAFQLPAGNYAGAANTWEYKVLSHPASSNNGTTTGDASTTSSDTPSPKPTSPSIGSNLSIPSHLKFIILFLSILIYLI